MAMTQPTKCEVEGTTYVAHPVPEDKGCYGCAGAKSGSLCMALPTCDRPFVVWVEATNEG